MGYVEYDSNNSGGSWWLEDKDWFALEKAGWIIEWKHLGHKYSEKGGYIRGDHGVPVLVPYAESGEFRDYDAAERKVGYKWLGALATGAYRPGLSLREAAEEWERITGANATDAGCPCCGQPHRFTEYDDDGKWLDSGPDTDYSASW